MREEIERAAREGRPEGLARALQGAKPGEVRVAVERIVAAAGKDGSLLDLAKGLAGRGEAVARRVACGLVAALPPREREEGMAVLRRLAEDEEPTVRSAAGKACGTLLQRDFLGTSDALRGWLGASSPVVRCVVVAAVASAAQTGRPEWAEPLLKLLEPLLADPDPLVRRSLGPRALGAGLLVAYPDTTFEYLARWSTSTDEQTLWNVAMAFSGPGAIRLVKKGLIVLRKLSLDERRPVRRAVSSAMWKLARKKPEIVRPELAQWLEDERRADVARGALNHL